MLHVLSISRSNAVMTQRQQGSHNAVSGGGSSSSSSSSSVKQNLVAYSNPASHAPALPTKLRPCRVGSRR